MTSIESAWGSRSIAELCSRVTSGGTPSRSRADFYHPATIPWVRTGDLDDTFVTNYSEFISETGVAGSSAKLLPKGTVLMAMYGATVGKLGILTEVATCNQASCAMVVDPATCDPRWLFYALLNDRERIVARANGAAQQNLSGTTIKTFEFLTPTLHEQHAIAEVLGALDDKIATNAKLAATIDDLLGINFMHLLREDYEIVRLGDIADINATTVKPASGGQLRYIDIASVNVGSYDFPQPSGWDEAPSRARRAVRRGDTLWSTVRPNRRSHALNLSNDPLLVGSTGLAVMSPRAVGWAYLYEVTRRPEFTAYLETVAEGSAYPAVRADKFEDAPVPLLSAKSRQLFESLAEPLRESAHSLSEENRSLAATRDALLPRLMSGTLRVKDAEAVLERAGYDVQRVVTPPIGEVPVAQLTTGRL
ncbi:MAG: restriction endonuclease subunit S [Arthrobacter sp.]|nr:restriction endonuclease subunit S [Arthrobacter sp.]